MRRIVGIVISVLGVLLLISAFVIKAQGARALLATGGLALLSGLAVIGLSFIKPQDAGPDAPPPLSAFDRITGIFYEPSRIFENLRFHPRWLAGFMVVALCAVIYQVAFVQRVTPEVIAAAPIDKAIEAGWIPAERAGEIREQTIEGAKSPISRAASPLNGIGVAFLITLFVSGIYLLCVMIFGGRINFWQALSVAVYASVPPSVLQYLLSVVLLYLKAPEDLDPIKGQGGLVRADLGVLFSAAEHPYLYTAAGFIGILTLYRVWLLATGLRYAGEKVSSSTAWTISLALWFLTLLLGLCAAALFPNFVS